MYSYIYIYILHVYIYIYIYVCVYMHEETSALPQLSSPAWHPCTRADMFEQTILTHMHAWAQWMHLRCFLILHARHARARIDMIYIYIYIIYIYIIYISLYIIIIIIRNNNGWFVAASRLRRPCMRLVGLVVIMETTRPLYRWIHDRLRHPPYRVREPLSFFQPSLLFLSESLFSMWILHRFLCVLSSCHESCKILCVINP